MGNQSFTAAEAAAEKKFQIVFCQNTGTYVARRVGKSEVIARMRDLESLRQVLEGMQ